MKKKHARIKRIVQDEHEEMLNYLYKNEIDLAENSQKRIKIFEGIINEGLGRKNRIILVTIAAFTLLSVGLLYSIQVPVSLVSIKLLCRGYSMHCSEDWNKKNVLNCERIEISEVNELEILPRFKRYHEISNLVVNSKMASLSSFEISKGAWVEFDAYRNNGLILYIKNGYVICNIDVNQGSLFFGNRKYEISSPQDTPPTRFIVRTDTLYGPSSQIAIKFFGISAFTLDSPCVDSIKFVAQKGINKGPFISTLSSGEIFFTETGGSHLLNSMEKLVIVSDSSHNLYSSLSNSELELNYTGEAKDIYTDGRKERKNLKPSILEFLFYSKPLAILWSSIIFLSGVLFSIRKSIFKS